MNKEWAEHQQHLFYLGVSEKEYSVLTHDLHIGLETATEDFVRYMLDPEHFFFICKYILNVELAPFQLAILKELWGHTFPLFIGSRGLSKSMILAVYSILRAMLEPGCKIIVIGAVFRQSKVIFDYIEKIWNNAPVLRSMFNTGSRKNVIGHFPDRWEFRIGESTITAVPTGHDGQKIRGLRANYIICDEFATMIEHIYENVIKGFSVVSADPIANMKKASRIKWLEDNDMMTTNLMEQIKENHRANQNILSGTAYYDFNHFAKYWKKHKAIIHSRGNKKKLKEIFGDNAPKNFDWTDYIAIRIPYDILPDGYMDEKIVLSSKATVNTSIFDMEFNAIFVNDSNGFFKRSLVESCVCKKPIQLPSGEVQFHASVFGNPRKKHVFAIDPASESDNFSIIILECNPDHRRVVYCWTTNKEKHQDYLNNKPTKAEKDFYKYAVRKARDLMKVFPCELISLDSQGGGVAVREAFHDASILEEGEHLIWEILPTHPLGDEKDKPSDREQGLHILEMVNFADSKYTSEANHGMRKDLEDKILLFPFFDGIEVDLANERGGSTLEDCVLEIEELKDELASIVLSQTPSGRDHWDTPDSKLPGMKKGPMRKDRYSSLLMANMAARRINNFTDYFASYKATGGYAYRMAKKDEEKPNKFYHSAPSWYTKHPASFDYYGKAVMKKR